MYTRMATATVRATGGAGADCLELDGKVFANVMRASGNLPDKKDTATLPSTGARILSVELVFNSQSCMGFAYDVLGVTTTLLYCTGTE